VNRSPFRVFGAVSALLLVAVGVGVVGATTSPASRSAPVGEASRIFQLGIDDEAEALGHPSRAFPLFQQLHVRVMRSTLWWGGPAGVTKRRPENAADPNDPAYNFSPFDEMVKRAADAGIKVMATLVGTPAWANGRKPTYVPPKNMADLRKFAYAVAKRYSGSFTPPGAEDPLPAIKLYLAWNEPNNPLFLRPQFRKVGGRYRVQSAATYARICNAVYKGVHSTGVRGEKVGCGVTSPRGNNRARGKRPSVSPLVFLQALARQNVRFDAYAHNPYYGNPRESPSTKPPGRTAVTLGNIDTLLQLLKRYYGGKHLWITEYGYQTKPPDPLFGVPWATQARYLAQAYRIARNNPKIDILIWFLLRDEPRRPHRDGWQSGLMTAGGKKKPAFRVFARLAK
jgi:hypothetical protein